MPDERPGPARRARELAGRAKAAPSRIEWLHANQEAVNDALRATIERLDAVAARLDRLEARLDGAVVGQAEVLRRLVATPARDAELTRLLVRVEPLDA